MGRKRKIDTSNMTREQRLMCDEKITWEDIYKEFKLKFPRLGKEAIYYRPANYLTIDVQLNDNKKVQYDYLNNKLKGDWFK